MQVLIYIRGVTSTYFLFFSLSGIAFCSVGFHPRLRAVVSSSSSNSSQYKTQGKSPSISHATPSKSSIAADGPVLVIACSKLITGPDNGDAIVLGLWGQIQP